MTHPIHRMSWSKFPKLFAFCVGVYAATLCKRLFHNADGIIRNISIKANANARIPVYVYPCVVGK